MRRILVRCPNTGEMFPVGISMEDEESFRDATPESNRVVCLECGHVHVWHKGDAILVPLERGWPLA